MNIKHLRQKKADLVKEAGAVLDAAWTTPMSDEQRAVYTALKAQIVQVDESIALCEEQLEHERSVATMHEAVFPAGSRVDVGQDNRTMQPFANIGEQLIAVYRQAAMGQTDPRLYNAAILGASETVDSDGGFLVQKDFSSELLRRAYVTGLLASRCRRIPISSNSNGLKILGIDESSRATGSRYGGVQIYWAAEAGTATAKKPKFREIELKLKKLIGLCYATDELLQDAAAFSAVANQSFGEEFGFVLDDVIVRGNGAGQPLGILNSGCIVSQAKETGQAAATINTTNLSRMWARQWARSNANAIWLFNKDCEPQLDELAIPVGTGGVEPRFVTYGPDGIMRIKGRAAMAIEQCETIGTVGDILLVDLSQYLLVDKGEMQSDSSIHVQFLTHETTFRFTMRVDGQPAWNSPLTPYKGTANTQSPFVSLATRA